MTMPHLMNCRHSPDGWCLDCVKELYDEYEKNEYHSSIKKAIHTLRKVGCTSITVNRTKFRQLLCEDEWLMPADNGTDAIRIFGINIIER